MKRKDENQIVSLSPQEIRQAMEHANTLIKEYEKKYSRKVRQRGVVTQKMVSFRCDLEVWEWLQQQPNKGRYINRLIADDMAR